MGYARRGGVNVPLYEFRCKDGHLTERIFPPIVEEGPLPEFVRCEAKGCRKLSDRQISRTGPVLFEGTGWTPKGGV